MLSRPFLKILGEASSKRDPSSSPPLPMKSEIGHFTILDKNIGFVFTNGVENQVPFFIRFLMIFGWFWVGFGSVLGTESTSNTYLNLALFSKPFFKDFGSNLVGF